MTYRFAGTLLVLSMLAIGACGEEGGGQSRPKGGTVAENDSVVVAGFTTAELKAQVDRLYPLQKLPLVIDSAWHQARALLDGTDTVRAVMAPELAMALGLQRAWADTASSGPKPKFRAMNLPYPSIYPVCRFESPDGKKEFIVTEVNGPAGGYNTYYLLAPFPPVPTDSINAYIIAAHYGNPKFSYERYCRIDYPNVTTRSLSDEWTPDGDSTYKWTGPTKTWRIDQ